MDQRSAWRHRGRVTDRFRLVRAIRGSATLRAVLAGAVIVASVSLLIDLTSRFLFRIPNPPVIYLLAVVYASFRFGLAGGLAGSVVSLLYATQFLSVPGQPFTYTMDNLGRLIVLFAVTPLMALMVGRLRMQSDRQLAAMRELSEVDALTGVANRRAFTRDGQRDLLHAHRMGLPIAVVAVDVDHFKRVNDVFGHAVGDAVLAEVARRIRRAIRDVDTLARLGGEEFAVLLPGADASSASLAAERIRESLSQEPISTTLGDLHVTASFGVARALPGEDLAGAMVRADEALYEAKRAGRDRVVVAISGVGAGSSPSGSVVMPADGHAPPRTPTGSDGRREPRPEIALGQTADG